MWMTMETRKLPRIAYVGTEALTPTHGTGVTIARHLSRYPRKKVIDLHYRAFSGKPLFPGLHVRRHDLRDWHLPFAWLKEVTAGRGKGPGPGGSLLYGHEFFDPLPPGWESLGGPPALLYSTCFTADDFMFLDHVHRNLPRRVPVLQHFLDLNLSDY